MAQQRRYPIMLEERLLATLLRQPICDQRMAGKGHEERSPPPRLNGRCRFESGALLVIIRAPRLLGQAL
jgi:hypothetical protein